MARIVLNEQQFKDYMRILRENEKKKGLINKIIAESMRKKKNEPQNKQPKL